MTNTEKKKKTNKYSGIYAGCEIVYFLFKHYNESKYFYHVLNYFFCKCFASTFNCNILLNYFEHKTLRNKSITTQTNNICSHLYWKTAKLSISYNKISDFLFTASYPFSLSVNLPNNCFFCLLSMIEHRKSTHKQTYIDKRKTMENQIFKKRKTKRNTNNLPF